MLCRRTKLFSIRTWLATDFSQNKNKLILDMRDARLFQRYESPALCLQLSLTLSWLRLNEDKCSLLACGSREKNSKLDLNYHHLPNAQFFFLTVYILLHLHWVSLCIYSVTSCFTCRCIICKHRRPPLLTELIRLHPFQVFLSEQTRGVIMSVLVTAAGLMFEFLAVLHFKCILTCVLFRINCCRGRYDEHLCRV